METEQSPDELKMKTLEAKKLSGHIFMELERNDLNIDDFLRLLRVCPPNGMIEQEYQTLLEYRDNGTDLIGDDPRTRAEKIRLKRVIHMGFKEVIMKMDVLSMLGALNYDTDNKYLPWRCFNTSMLTFQVEKGGKFILLSGTMGSGKTHLGSLLTYDMIHNKGLIILTNINFLGDNENLKRIYSTSELLIEGIKCSLDGRKWVAVLDESGVWQHTQDHATKKNISWDKVYRLIRKFHGSMMFIDQRSGGFTRTIKEFATVHLYKPSKNTLKANIFSSDLKGHFYIKSVPATPMKFDTLDIAYFRHDVDIDKVLSQATNITGSQKQKLAIIEFLEKQKEENATQELDIGDREVAIYLRERSIELGRKLSYQEIGELLGRSHTAVNYWYRDYKKQLNTPKATE